MKNLLKNLKDFAHDDEGVATLDFVAIFPVFLIFIFATFDSGLLMAKYVVLENSLDRSIRDVRLGGIGAGEDDNGAATFKDSVCERASALIPDCSDNLFIKMVRVDSSAAFSAPATNECSESSVPNVAATSFSGADPNDIIYLRACLIVDRIFPSALTGLFEVHPSGGILLIADTAYVVEPA